MRRSLPFLLSLIVCVGCASVAKPGDLDVLNAGLRDAFARYDQTLVAQRPALHFASGRTVQDCADYLVERRSVAIDEAVNNRIVAQEYLVCDAVALLREASPVGRSAYRPDSYGRDLLRRLDLSGFASSLRPLIGDGQVTLAELPDVAAHVEAHAVTVETADWRYRFEVVADIDSKAGEHEWLVWFSDEARKGNYRNYETLVVRNPVSMGRLTARKLP
jgi:hypothetical protein